MPLIKDMIFTMKKTTFLTFIFSLCFLTQNIVPNIAQAQGFQNPADAIRAQQQASLPKVKQLNSETILVSLVHYSYMDPDQFGLLLRVPDITAGCFTSGNLQYKAEFKPGGFMDIHVKGFRRTAVKTQNPSYDCNPRNQSVQGMIVLSARDLGQKGIKQLRLKNGSKRDKYNVEILDDKVILHPESMVTFIAQGLTGINNNQLVHSFGKSGLVALHVPMANANDDIVNAVRNFAARNALVPAAPSKSNKAKYNVFYYADTNGRWLDQLGEKNHLEIGTIDVPRPYDTPQGQMGLPVPLKVFITRPETTL